MESSIHSSLEEVTRMLSIRQNGTSSSCWFIFTHEITLAQNSSAGCFKLKSVCLIINPACCYHLGTVCVLRDLLSMLVQT